MHQDYFEAICHQHGAFLRREALALGLRDRDIARHVRDGAWVRVRHGAYTMSSLWDEADELARHLIRSRAAFRTAGSDVVLSHTSALAVHETPWWDLPLDAVHLTRLDQRVGRHCAGVIQHGGRVRPEDVEHLGDLRFMNATRTALELTTITDVERSLVVVNGLLHAGKTTRRQLENHYVEMELWPRTLSTELVLRLCHPAVESVLESRVSSFLFRHGFPTPVPQLEIRDESGRVLARLDFAWPEIGVWIEADGKLKYDVLRRAGESAVDVLMREKRREERVRELTGWECLRITWADLEHPERLVARIRAVLERRSRPRTVLS
jgi:hypothetical protein